MSLSKDCHREERISQDRGSKELQTERPNKPSAREKLVVSNSAPRYMGIGIRPKPDPIQNFVMTSSGMNLAQGPAAFQGSAGVGESCQHIEHYM